MKRIDIMPAGHGHFKVTASYRNKTISTVTTNTQAIDRYRDNEVPAKSKQYFYTRKQAATALYNEIKRGNNLN